MSHPFFEESNLRQLTDGIDLAPEVMTRIIIETANKYHVLMGRNAVDQVNRMARDQLELESGKIRSFDAIKTHDKPLPRLDVNHFPDAPGQAARQAYNAKLKQHMSEALPYDNIKVSENDESNFLRKMR